MRIEIKIPITAQHLFALGLLYKWRIEFEPANPKQMPQLQYEHMIDMQGKIRLMLERKKKKYTLSMFSPEAVAFVDLWGKRKLDEPLSKLAVQNILQVIHKKARAPRPNN